MGIYISELFPNPAGKDAGNEWIEVCNDGAQAQSLVGWKLKDASAKSFTIGNVSITPQSCVVFGNAQTKISLNNDKETISLFDALGALQDSASYNVVVKDNQALTRISSTSSLEKTTAATKGDIKNIIEGLGGEKKIPTTIGVGTLTEASGQIQPEPDIENGQMLKSEMSVWEVILIGICVAGVLALIFMMAIAKIKEKNKEMQ